MNFESKFDSIMDYIEEHIEQKPNETVRIIAKEFGMTTRTLSEGFQFVTDISLSSYIRLRRVIRALKYKLTEDCALDVAAAYFGFPDQPTLSKACKELLGISPSEVTMKTLVDYPPLHLEDVICGATADLLSKIGVSNQALLLNMTEELQNLSEKISTLNETYCFDKVYLDLIFTYAQEFDVALEKIFEFIKSMQYDMTYGTLEVNGCPYRLKELALMNLQYGIDIWEAKHLIPKLHQGYVKDITRIEPDVMEICMSETARIYRLSLKLCDTVTILMKKHEIPLNEFKNVFHECLYYFHGHIHLAIVCHKNLAEILEHVYSKGEFPEKISQEFPSRLYFPELDEFSKELHEYIIDEDPEDSLEEKCTSFDLDMESIYCDEIFP